MTVYNLSPFRWPKIHDQQSLTFRWRSFWRWGRESSATCFAYKGGQRFLYDWLQPIGSVITLDALPNIVDALLMLILKMGQGGYCNLLPLQRWPNLPVWLTTSYWQCDYPGRRTKDRWRAVVAHSQDGAGRVLHSVLPIKAAKYSFMTDCNVSAVWLPRTHDQKSLMLNWRSFSRWGREGVVIISAYEGGQYIDQV